LLTILYLYYSVCMSYLNLRSIISLIHMCFRGIFSLCPVFRKWIWVVYFQNVSGDTENLAAFNSRRRLETNVFPISRAVYWQLTSRAEAFWWMTRGQCDARRTVTFLISEHHHPSTVVPNNTAWWQMQVCIGDWKMRGTNMQVKKPIWHIRKKWFNKSTEYCTYFTLQNSL